MVLFIKKLLDISLQLSGFDVVIYFGNHGFDKDKAYFTQLLILMGNFHIHKMKWFGSKLNFSHFINYFKLYCKVLCNCPSKKAIRSHNIVSYVMYAVMLLYKVTPQNVSIFLSLYFITLLWHCFIILMLFIFFKD